MNDEYTGPFNIERYELGVWESIEVTNDFFDALYLASAYVQWDDDYYTVERFRIIDANNRII